MNLKRLLPVLMFAAAVSMTGCKEKDSKIQERVEEKLRANQETAGATVTVVDGVATLNGQVNSESGRIESGNLAKDAKGVKSVVNNLTVAAPVTSAPVIVTPDDPLTTAVRDATKDHPGVTATVVNGTVTLTGTISKDGNRVLMQKINALRPGKIENNLTVNP